MTVVTRRISADGDLAGDVEALTFVLEERFVVSVGIGHHKG